MRKSEKVRKALHMSTPTNQKPTNQYQLPCMIRSKMSPTLRGGCWFIYLFTTFTLLLPWLHSLFSRDSVRVIQQPSLCSSLPSPYSFCSIGCMRMCFAERIFIWMTLVCILSFLCIGKSKSRGNKSDWWIWFSPIELTVLPPLKEPKSVGQRASVLCCASRRKKRIDFGAFRKRTRFRLRISPSLTVIGF